VNHPIFLDIQHPRQRTGAPAKRRQDSDRLQGAAVPVPASVRPPIALAGGRRGRLTAAGALSCRLTDLMSIWQVPSRLAGSQGGQRQRVSRGQGPEARWQTQRVDRCLQGRCRSGFVEPCHIHVTLSGPRGAGRVCLIDCLGIRPSICRARVSVSLAGCARITKRFVPHPLALSCALIAAHLPLPCANRLLACRFCTLIARFLPLHRIRREVVVKKSEEPRN
jgi:hypothetical protein